MALLLIIPACDQKPRDLNDERFRYGGEPFTIRVHRFDTHQEMNKAVESLRKNDKDRGADLLGYSVMSVNPNTGKVSSCDIFVKKSDGNTELETWGHELKHCIKGSWHR